MREIRHRVGFEFERKCRIVRRYRGFTPKSGSTDLSEGTGRETGLKDVEWGRVRYEDRLCTSIQNCGTLGCGSYRKLE